MTYRKDFNDLLSDEDFQNGIFSFSSFGSDEKKAFINRYSITQEEFVRARTLLKGLNFRDAVFSEEKLNYLWQRLNVGNPVTSGRKLPSRKSGKLTGWVGKAAAILFIPLLVASGWLFYQTLNPESFWDENTGGLAEAWNTVIAPVGGRANAVLPDGSEVWLNSGSSIRYPIVCKEAYREVILSGEGFFKVAKNPDKPMLVTASGIQIKVYGTSFNINAYEDNPDIETVLVDGEISVVKLNEKGKPEETEYKMRPGEVGRLNRQSNSIALMKATNMEVFTGWINGKYVFRNTPFKAILKRFEKMHNVEFVLEDQALGDYSLDATFEDQNLDRIMEIFAVSLPIRWRSVNAEQNNDNTFSTRRIIISKDNSRKL